MAKYERKRSARLSTPRHPITMASTAEPPDPMPCALAAILLPESCARGCRMQNTCFRGLSACTPGRVCSDRSCVRDARVRRGCAAGAWRAAWVRGSGAWRRGWAACRWSGPASGGAGGCGRCAGGRVRGWATRCLPAVRDRNMRGHLGWCGIRWLFRGFCSSGNLERSAAAVGGSLQCKRGILVILWMSPFGETFHAYPRSIRWNRTFPQFIEREIELVTTVLLRHVA